MGKALELGVSIIYLNSRIRDRTIEIFWRNLKSHQYDSNWHGFKMLKNSQDPKNYDREHSEEIESLA